VTGYLAAMKGGRQGWIERGLGGDAAHSKANQKREYINFSGARNGAGRRGGGPFKEKKILRESKLIRRRATKREELKEG